MDTHSTLSKRLRLRISSLKKYTASGVCRLTDLLLYSRLFRNHPHNKKFLMIYYSAPAFRPKRIRIGTVRSTDFFFNHMLCGCNPCIIQQEIIMAHTADTVLHRVVPMSRPHDSAVSLSPEYSRRD